MKKAVLLILGALLAAPAVAQVSYETVTATVRDPDGQALAGARYSMRLVDAVGQPVSSASTPDGEMFNAKPVFGNLDASGSFSVGLVPNTILTKPSGTRWLISIESPLPPEQSQILTYAGPWSINYYATISASVDLSAQLSGLSSNVTYVNLQRGQATFAGWLTGTGFPTLTCAAGQHEGYFYSNPASELYQCSQQDGIYAWRQVGGVGSISIEYNGSKTTPVVIDQGLLNFLNAPSAGLDAGYQAVLPKPDANGGWGFETATAQIAQSITPTYPIPFPGQNIIMLPYSCSTSSTSWADSICGAAPGYSLTNSIHGKGPASQVTTTVTGWAYNGVEGLPSFVSAANVTAVYGGVTSWWTGGSLAGGTCGGVIFDDWNNGTNTYSPGLTNKWPYTAMNTLTEIDGGSPTTFNYTTGYFSIGNQQSTLCSGGSTRVAIPYLVVYYTGSAPPATTNLNINAPLSLVNNTLGLQWPLNEAIDTGSSTAYAISIPWMTTANLTPGADFWVIPANTNTTTTPTLNLNGWGNIGILGNGAAAIQLNDIAANKMAHFVYGVDGNMHLLNPQTEPIVTPGTSGQIAYYSGNGSTIGPASVGADLALKSGALNVQMVIGSGAPVNGTAALVQAKASTGTGAVAFASNVTSGDAILVSFQGSTTGVTMTDTLGTSLSQIATYAGTVTTTTWCGIASASGADTVTVAGGPTTIAIEEASGVSCTLDGSAGTGNAGYLSTLTASVTTNFSYDYLFAVAAFNSNDNSQTWSSPFTVDVNTAGLHNFLAHYVTTTVGTYAATIPSTNCTAGCGNTMLLVPLKATKIPSTQGMVYYDASNAYKCYIYDANVWQTCSSGGGGAVSSVFGRTGAVVAASGDYSVGQVTGAAPSASPILTGTVTLPSTDKFSTIPASGTCSSGLAVDESGNIVTMTCGGGSMVYPGAGIPNSTGTAWGTSYSTSGSGTAVILPSGTAGAGKYVDGGTFAWTALPFQSLTTTGTTGAATLSSGVLNVPQYQGAITLTTTGTSGAATLVGNTLNVPQYSTPSVTWPATNSVVVSNGTNSPVGVSGTITGSVLQANNAAAPSFSVPGLALGNGGAAVTATTYTFKCDSATTTLDRGTFVDFNAASSVTATMPDVGASGCANNFYVGMEVQTSAVTVNRTTSSTFNVYSAGSVSTGATSFTVKPGQQARISTNGSNWDVFIYGGGTTVTVASGTAAMGTAAIASGACASVVTVAATGVATTDTIAYTPNADPTAVTGYGPSASGSLYIWAYPTAGNVNFKACNNTSASITPAALTLNWKVTR